MDCYTDMEQVKAVFGKSHGFMNTVGNSLYNTIARIGDDAHIYGHGGSDYGEGNSDEKE